MARGEAANTPLSPQIHTSGSGSSNYPDKNGLKKITEQWGWKGGERWGLGLRQSVMEKLRGGAGAAPGGLCAAGDLFGSSIPVFHV